MRLRGQGASIRPALLLAVVAALGAASCYSSNYRDELTANVNLIAELADKLADYCRAGFVIGGRPVSSEEMGEFYYSLRKARGWAQMTASRDGARASHRDFVALLESDEAFVRSADEFRLAGAHDPAVLAELMRQHDRVRTARARVLADLRAERR